MKLNKMTTYEKLAATGLCLTLAGGLAQAETDRDSATNEAKPYQNLPADSDSAKQYKHADKSDAVSRSHKQMLQAESLIGQPIYSSTVTAGQPRDTNGLDSEQQVGTLHDIVVNTQTNEVEYGVINTDQGIMDFTGGLYAVPWSTFRFQSAGSSSTDSNTWGNDQAKQVRITAAIDSTRLEQAEGFDSGNWPTKPNSQWDHPNRQARSDNSQRDRSADRQTDQTRQANRLDTQAQGQGLEQSTHLYRVSELTGSSVNNAQGEEVGTIDDIVISEQGRVAFAIINADSMLDGDKTMAAVPFSALRTTGKDQPLRLNTTKQQLQSKAFSQANGPDFNDSQWARGIYQDYGQEKDYVVLGYSAVNADGQDAWSKQSDYNARYDRINTQTVSGEVKKVETIKPDDKSREGVCVSIEDAQGKTQKLHLGPQDYVKGQISLDELKNAENITATGSMVTINGEQVLLTREIQVDGRKISLRNESGEPMWDRQSSDQQSRDRRQQNGSIADQSRNPSDRNANDQ